MQTIWNSINERSRKTTPLVLSHPANGKRRAPARVALAVARNAAEGTLKSHVFNTSSSVPAQPSPINIPTFPVGDNWAAAREAFLTRHGPRAVFPRRPALSKELRKALLATEMAAWEAP
jgi:hypothetical protein